MILRFKEASSAPRYIAFNAILKTYTMNAEEVKRGYVMQIACNYFDHILEEINFNGYDYTDDLHRPAIIEDIPF